jgi:hypothetical protein
MGGDKFIHVGHDLPVLLFAFRKWDFLYCSSCFAKVDESESRRLGRLGKILKCQCLLLVLLLLVVLVIKERLSSRLSMYIYIRKTLERKEGRAGGGVFFSVFWLFHDEQKQDEGAEQRLTLAELESETSRSGESWILSFAYIFRCCISFCCCCVGSIKYIV